MPFVPLLLNVVYLLVALATAPWWTRKARGGWGERLGKIAPLPAKTTRPRLLIHAVSVGEVNLIRPLVDALAGEVDVVVAATTDTGIVRARELYSKSCHVVRYPIDASWAVRRFLRAVQPDAAALVELELWPNFMLACAKRRVPVAVVNGRLSERSFRGYRRGKRFIGWMFRQLAFAAVQDEEYAERFRAMGVADARCIVAGSMKWDAASSAVNEPAAERLAKEMGIDRGELVVVAGSTAPDEHALLRDAVAEASRAIGKRVQLVCAPRRPEWFDEAAGVLAGCARRSKPVEGATGSGLFLLDTIGELGVAYQLADVAVVGRSFGELFGSDPMQPAAIGKAVIIGPAVRDFDQAVAALRDDWAIVQTTRAGLAGELMRLLGDPALRGELGANARRCVVEHQGATARHADLLRGMLRKPTGAR